MARPFILLALVTAHACARPLPELRIDGSPGVAPLVAELADAYRAANPRAATRIGSGLGTSARIAALAEGRIDIAMASHGVDTASLRQRGIAVHEIARTAVVFAVNAGVEHSDVTQAQVCDILSGRRTHWTDDLPIAPLARPPDEVDAEVALAAIPCLRGLSLAPSVRVVERPDDMAASIASTPGAFGITSMPHVLRSNGRIRALELDGIAPSDTNVASGRYPMARSAFLLVRAPESPAVRAFLDYARSAEGIRVLRAAGAIAVK